MIEFKVNEYITLELEGEETIIYILGERFRISKYLLVNTQENNSLFPETLESVDEITRNSDNHLVLKPLIKLPRNWEDYEKIPPDVKFWGHCSNLQVWAENNYNTCLLHRTLAFPLLKGLVDAGDPNAKEVFKNEIVKRLKTGFPTVVMYLIEEDYLKYLDKDEKKIAFYENNRMVQSIINNALNKGLRFKWVYPLLEKLIKEGDKRAEEFYKNEVINVSQKYFNEYESQDSENDINKKLKNVINLLEKFILLVKENYTDLAWSNYINKDELIKEYLDHIKRLKRYNFSQVDNLLIDFLCENMIDVAVDSGWSDIFMSLSGVFMTEFQDLADKLKLNTFLSHKRDANYLNKEDLVDILPNKKEELKQIFVGYLEQEGIKYKVPSIPLTNYQEKLYNQLYNIDESINWDESLSESEKIVLVKEKDKIAAKLISNLKKTQKIPKKGED